MDLEFIKVSDECKSSRPDGRKSCFLFSRDGKVNDFMTELSKRISAEATKNLFLREITVYVPIAKYQEAVVQGLDIILNDKSYEHEKVYWLNCYNDKESWGQVQILQMAVANDRQYPIHRYLKASTKKDIESWNKKLESVLGTEVVAQKYLDYVKFFIKRTTTSHLEHESILNKIRNSSLFEDSPFVAYALIDYYGEFIEL